MELDALIIQIDSFSKNRGQGRIFWITQMLTGFTGLSTVLFLIIHNTFDIYIFPFILPIFVLGIMFLILNVIGGTLLSRILDSLKKGNTALREVHNKIEEIGEILDAGNIIFELIQKLLKFRYFVKIFYPSKMRSYDKIFKMQNSLILSLLTDLRSDLRIRIKEQGQTLRIAKSEVESTIKGNSELEQVSALQKARLDRQIEQFEELERVLVKM